MCLRIGSCHTFVLIGFRGYIEAFSGLEQHEGHVICLEFTHCVHGHLRFFLSLCCSLLVFISEEFSLYGLLTPKVPYILEARAVFFLHF